MAYVKCVYRHLTSQESSLYPVNPKNVGRVGGKIKSSREPVLGDKLQAVAQRLKLNGPLRKLFGRVRVTLLELPRFLSHEIIRRVSRRLRLDQSRLVNQSMIDRYAIQDSDSGFGIRYRRENC